MLDDSVSCAAKCQEASGGPQARGVEDGWNMDSKLLLLIRQCKSDSENILNPQIFRRFLRNILMYTRLRELSRLPWV